MQRIGLTGGIASGKSALSDALERRGLPVIDADRVSHQLMAPGEPGYIASVEHFGDGILNDDGYIDRARLRQHIFDRPEARAWLENLLHPLIRERMLRISRQTEAERILWVVPLLFESGFDELVDLSLAIDCPRSIQIERLIRRDDIDRALAERMIDAQMPNEERLRRADLHIRNDGSVPVEKLADQVLHLLRDKPLASP